MNKEITLCSSKICPWSHCVELALMESGVEYKRLEVDLNNKQTWYRPDIHSEGELQVPTVIYGRPGSQTNDESLQYIPLTNAASIIAFITTLSAREPLLPATPKSLEKMHRFVDIITSNLVPATDNDIDPTIILHAVEALQALLPSDGYAVGQWSIADAIAVPFLARAIPSLKNNFESYRESDKYARFKKYYVDLTNRESFRMTFHEVVVNSKVGPAFN
ncbi:hypothetical protein MD484_g7100, partial [Candolleomyces efflorescens]